MVYNLSFVAGTDRKLSRRRRLIYLTFAIFFCGTCMIYYAYTTSPNHSLNLMDIGLMLKGGERFNSKTATLQDSANASNKDNHLIPRMPYDRHTYGLKLFECHGNSPMASPKYTEMGRIFYDIGENVYYVNLHLYDENQVSRTSGGDVILMWAEQVGGDGRVAGHVTDHMNGSYTGKFNPFWMGKTVFRGKIASTVENQCLRSNALFRYGNTVYAKQSGWGIHAVFKLGEDNIFQTKCGANPYIHLSTNLCNFTTLNANTPWFCGAPLNSTSLICSNLHHFTVGQFDTSSIPSDEKMTNVGHGVIAQDLKVYSEHRSNATTSVKCNKYPSWKTWTYTQPSGYWAKGRWNCIYCDNSAMQFSYTAFRNCLKGKYFSVIGDSTTRHIAEFIIKHVLMFGEIDLKDGLGDGPLPVYQVHYKYKGFNITTTYSKHEFPFHNSHFPPNNITSIPLELQRLESAPVDGKDLIVLLHQHIHLQAYPIDQFQLRMRLIIPAIKRLLKVKPGVKILFKGPHVSIDDQRWFDPRISLIYMDILHSEFRDIRDHVIFLDTWSITVAHNSENFHPGGNAFHSQIHQLMSHICTY